MSSIALPFTKTTLANGLDVIVHESHQVPIVAVNVWYHVGSKNERPGMTGFAQMAIGAASTQVVSVLLAGAHSAMPMAWQLVVVVVATAVAYVALVRK